MKLVIQRLGHLGDAIAMGEDGPVYLKGFLPGEELEGDDLAAMRIITPSPNRVRPPCAHARAFLKDAPILVLDEATSALDSEVEAHIQDALAKVMSGKTVLAIAHRLSTIAEMDRIIVMDQGHIAESGSHTELLAKGGLYAKYWARQSGGFIGVDVKAAE